MTKIRRKTHQIGPALSGYHQALRQADESLAKEGIDIRADTWRELTLEWFTPCELERDELAKYIAAHESRLGEAWAREVLRLEVFLRVESHSIIVEHYERALRRYPRCALVEIWVAVHLMRHSIDFWRVREMLNYAAGQLPRCAKPQYELGFMNYLLGDFPGALQRFDQAAALLADGDEGGDAELGGRIFYNRGVVRYAMGGDKKQAIADIEHAIRLKPDYAQAKETLCALRGGLARWISW